MAVRAVQSGQGHSLPAGVGASGSGRCPWGRASGGDRAPFLGTPSPGGIPSPTSRCHPGGRPLSSLRPSASPPFAGTPSGRDGCLRPWAALLPGARRPPQLSGLSMVLSGGETTRGKVRLLSAQQHTPSGSCCWRHCWWPLSPFSLVTWARGAHGHLK